MAKIATDRELAELVAAIVRDAPLQDEPRHRMFVETIAEAIGAYYALELSAVMVPAIDLPHWTVSFHASADTPGDGGPFAMIDTDVTVEEWLSEVRADPNLSHEPATGHATRRPAYSEIGSGVAGAA